MKLIRILGSALILGLGSTFSTHAAITIFEATGGNPAAITPTRDAFRLAIGGGDVAGANGSFGGVRREINWDGVPDAFSDANLLPANFFNVNSPRGAVFSTPGTGFLVSSSTFAVPSLFGFPNDFQTFSPQRLFTAVNSNITDISFFVPGTTTPATTSAFGVIFTDVEVSGLTKLEFFNSANDLIFTRNALTTAGNQGLAFLGGVASAGEQFSRVRITSGANTIVSNGVLGNPNDDVVAMDDFIFAEPRASSVPESGPGAALFALVVMGLAAARRGRA